MTVAARRQTAGLFFQLLPLPAQQNLLAKFFPRRQTLPLIFLQ